MRRLLMASADAMFETKAAVEESPVMTSLATAAVDEDVVTGVVNWLTHGSLVVAPVGLSECVECAVWWSEVGVASSNDVLSISSAYLGEK